MPEYSYQGVDRAGKKVNGSLNVETEGALRMALRGQGIRPVKIAKVGAMNTDLGAYFKKTGSTLTHEQLIIFTRQLQVLISSSVPLVQALDVLADQAIDKGTRAVISAIKEKVSGGAYLWEALMLFPKAFPRLYIALIRAGEASGSTDQMLKRLGRYLEDAARLKKMVKKASMYPAVVGVIGFGVIGLMLVVVIPKFESMLLTQGQKLPLPTQIVVNMSHFIQNNFAALAIGVVAAGYAIFRYVRSPEGKASLDRWLFDVPVLGAIMQKAGIARFARTMQTLLASGVNLIDAIDICRGTIDNAVIEDAITKIRHEVESGKTLGQVVSRIKAFPKMMVQMIMVGESTGNLDKMLDKVADFYEEDVDGAVDTLARLIEPVMLVVLGGLVGGMLIAMYLPVFQQAGGV
jgi:type IV pilus assembly protein PilC